MFFIHFHCFLPSQDKKHANVRNIYMHFLRTLRHLFDAKRDLTPFFERQAELLCQSSDILVRMFTAVDPEQWILRQREIKSLETQGDALLQDYREQLSERLMGSLSRTDLTTIAMSMDDSLDVIKDAAKALRSTVPRRSTSSSRISPSSSGTKPWPCATSCPCSGTSGTRLRPSPSSATG